MKAEAKPWEAGTRRKGGRENTELSVRKRVEKPQRGCLSDYAAPLGRDRSLFTGTLGWTAKFHHSEKHLLSTPILEKGDWESYLLYLLSRSSDEAGCLNSCHQAAMTVKIPFALSIPIITEKAFQVHVF